MLSAQKAALSAMEEDRRRAEEERRKADEQRRVEDAKRAQEAETQRQNALACGLQGLQQRFDQTLAGLAVAGPVTPQPLALTNISNTAPRRHKFQPADWEPSQPAADESLALTAAEQPWDPLPSGFARKATGPIQTWGMAEV